MELLLPRCDGVFLLHHIHKELDGYHPLFYVVSLLPGDLLADRRRLFPPDACVHLAVKPQDPETVAANARRFLHTTPAARGVSPPDDPDRLVDWLLAGLESKPFLRRAVAAKIALRHLLDQPDDDMRMMSVYTHVAEKLGATPSAAERLLRSYVGAVRGNGYGRFADVFADIDTTNAAFYWRACRYLRELQRDSQAPNG